jgi:hypothetical protein
VAPKSSLIQRRPFSVVIATNMNMCYNR